MFTEEMGKLNDECRLSRLSNQENGRNSGCGRPALDSDTVEEKTYWQVKKQSHTAR